MREDDFEVCHSKRFSCSLISPYSDQWQLLALAYASLTFSSNITSSQIPLQVLAGSGASFLGSGSFCASLCHHYEHTGLSRSIYVPMAPSEQEYFRGSNGSDCFYLIMHQHPSKELGTADRIQNAPPPNLPHFADES
jgi:hypothetical protein